MENEWKPIKTAPRTGRRKILLKTPYSGDNGVIAFSDTWWRAGYSVVRNKLCRVYECKPTHWKEYKDTHNE